MRYGLGLWLGRSGYVGGGVAPGVPIPVSPASSYTFTGDTDAFELTAPLPLGQYVMGEPFFVADAAAAFSKTGAPSVAVASYIANGLEENFMFPNSPRGQGFDAMFGASSLTSVAGTSNYISTRNKDVTAAGANYPVAIDDEKTLIKASRTSGATTSSWGIISGYRPLTIIPTAKRPNIGDFRPAMASLDKASWVNISDISLAGCRSIDVSSLITGLSGGLPTYAATLAMWRDPLTSFGTGGDTLRQMQILTHINATNYSADLAILPWATSLHLHSSAISDAQKRELAKFVVQSAIDMTGEVERGFVGATGAGQWETYWYILATAVALTGKARFQTAINLLNSGVRQCGWTKNVGKYTQWPSKNEGGLYQNVGPQHIEYQNQAYWAGEGYEGFSGDTNEQDRTYRAVSGKGRNLTVMPLCAFVAWGSTPAGYDIITNGGAQSDITVRTGAMLHLCDLEIMTYLNSDGGYITADMVNSYNILRPLIPVAKMTTYPPAIPSTFTITAGAAQISWDATSFVTNNYGSVGNPVTGVKIEVSQDGVQFEQASTTAAATIAAVPGVPVWARLSVQNANGYGVPSRTWPKYTVSADTNKVTPTGTATGTVTNTVAPKIMLKRYPQNRAPLFDAATGASVINAGDPVYLGAGIWTGAITGAPTVTVEVELTALSNVWTAGTGIIATDVNAKYYTGARDLSEAGKRIRVKSVWGGVTAYSAPMTYAAVPSVSAFSRVSNISGAYLQKPTLNSVVDGKAGLFAFKGRLLGDDGLARRMFAIGLGSSAATLLVERRSTTNTVRIILKNPSGIILATLNSVGTVNVAAGEVVLMASWDLDAGVSSMWLGNTNTLSGTPSLTNDFIDYTPISGAVVEAGFFGSYASTMDAEIDYTYFDPTYLDLSVSGNRDKFATASAMGYYGQGPTGSIPAFFTAGDAVARNSGLANRGYGGYFYVADDPDSTVSFAFVDIP